MNIQYINKILGNRVIRFILSIGSVFYLVYIDIYGTAYQTWPVYIALPLTIIVIGINLSVANYDSIPILTKLLKTEQKLEQTLTEFDEFRILSLTETNELKKLIAQFIERGMFYTDKLKDILKQSNDFVCVMKSSEGLSEVYKALEKKNLERMLPFTSVIHNIPGAIRPFERMDVYFIPINKIPFRKEQSLKNWMAILANDAKKAREIFLAKIPSGIAKLAEPFSYKYLAFYVSRSSLVTGSKNRKFNRHLISALLHNQSSDEFDNLKKDFSDFIKSKELALNLEWHLFIKTSDKEALLKKNKTKISDAFYKAGFCSINDFANTDKILLGKPLYPVLKKELSLKQCENLAQKIITECSNTIRILRDAGVSV